MNRTDDAHHASLFGPASEPINIAQFLEYALSAETQTHPTSLFKPDKSSIHGWTNWFQLPEDRRAAVEADCSVDDVQALVDGALSDVRSAAHIRRLTRATLDTIYKSATGKTRVPRRHRDVDDPEYVHASVRVLQDRLDGMRLASWKVEDHAALLMRTPKTADYNALSEIRKSSPGVESPPDDKVCLITFSVHVRTARSRNYFTRMSQHAILSSQSIGDMFEVIPCISNEIPREIMDDEGNVTGYEQVTTENPAFIGCVVCIEGVAYGDGQSEEDYSDKLIQRLSSRDRSSRPAITKGPAMHDTQLLAITLRLNQPYWVLHAGNCEHTIVIDEIRLKHPSDVTDGYPLTTYIQPTMIDMCRGCSKVPAVWAVRGDVRLGESPCLLCAPCWRRMGSPPDNVVVARLPRYEMAW